MYHSFHTVFSVLNIVEDKDGCSWKLDARGSWTVIDCGVMEDTQGRCWVKANGAWTLSSHLRPPCR